MIIDHSSHLESKQVGNIIAKEVAKLINTKLPDSTIQVMGNSNKYRATVVIRLGGKRINVIMFNETVRIIAESKIIDEISIYNSDVFNIVANLVINHFTKTEQT